LSIVRLDVTHSISSQYCCAGLVMHVPVSERLRSL
jgi:hypothetical protein